jgi:hypothetical protein
MQVNEGRTRGNVQTRQRAHFWQCGRGHDRYAYQYLAAHPMANQFSLEEDENGVSRTSSTSAKDKSNVGKRGKNGKQRRDDSDSFDSRNQYTPYWGPQQQTWVPQQQYVPPANPQYAAQAPSPGFPGQAVPVYAQQPPAYPNMPAMMPANQSYPQYAMPPVRIHPCLLNRDDINLS